MADSDFNEFARVDILREPEKVKGMNTKAILLTADLIRRRDDMRTILGDRYEARVKDYRAVLVAATAKYNKPMVETALALAKEMDKAGEDPSMLFAAMVDEIEGAETARKAGL